MQPVQAEKSGGGSKVFMIVAIVLGSIVALGCCGAGAMYFLAKRSVSRFVDASIEAESTANLSSLRVAECSYATAEHFVPSGGTAAPPSFVTSAGPIPPTPPPAHTKVIGDFATDPGFHELGFDPGVPVYFSYSVRPDPAAPGGVVLTARGNPGGDAMATFRSHCTLAGTECTCTRPAPEP